MNIIPKDEVHHQEHRIAYFHSTWEMEFQIAPYKIYKGALYPANIIRVVIQPQLMHLETKDPALRHLYTATGISVFALEARDSSQLACLSWPLYI